MTLVAASDAQSYLKEQADFVCTGERDEEVIEQAQALTPGTYWLSRAIEWRHVDK